MTEFDKKIMSAFPGLVVRKDLVKTVRGNAIVPSYVLEYLLGQYCATDDEPGIAAGIETVREILRKHYVHRNEAELVRSNIREKGRHRVIDKISVSLNDKDDVYEAEFSNLGLKKVVVSPQTVKTNPKLLVSGIWCIADVEYEHVEEKNVNPWLLGRLKPVQLSAFDFESYLAARCKFTSEEWIDLLIQTIGLNPGQFDRRAKLHHLARLIPFCERNYNILELGPKGTGKSHVYSEFSPHGILLSGGEVTVPKLFVNNSNGRIGLVGYWDCVAFDEFAGKGKRVDKSLVDIMKNYMANKSFSRGVETLGAEASMAFVGNTSHDVEHMLKHSNLFCDLPDKFYDSAFLDRIHFYIPGWESDIIRAEMFSAGYGFVVDYLAEILRALRNYDYSDRYREYFSLSDNISTRDRDSINKTFSGLLKLIFPGGKAGREEMAELLEFSIEGRKRVKDQLLRIDSTYADVNFSYSREDGDTVGVATREEKEFPQLYHCKTRDRAADPEHEIPPENPPHRQDAGGSHIVIEENQTGVCYDDLFGEYIKKAGKIVITDPYIRLFYQARNLMDFVEMVVRQRGAGNPATIHLFTVEDEFKACQQLEYFDKIREAALVAGIDFSWEFDPTGTIHARHIVTDTGWKIILDRGLDIFQQYEMNDTFNLSNRMQQFRSCKAFEATYLRLE